MAITFFHTLYIVLTCFLITAHLQLTFGSLEENFDDGVMKHWNSCKANDSLTRFEIIKYADDHEIPKPIGNYSLSFSSAGNQSIRGCLVSDDYFNLRNDSYIQLSLWTGANVGSGIDVELSVHIMDVKGKIDLIGFFYTVPTITSFRTVRMRMETKHSGTNKILIEASTTDPSLHLVFGQIIVNANVNTPNRSLVMRKNWPSYEHDDMGDRQKGIALQIPSDKADSLRFAMNVYMFMSLILFSFLRNIL